MSENYFGCTVKYDKLEEDGMIKSVSEQYLINALNVHEAGEVLSNQLSSFYSGDFEINKIGKMKLAEVLSADDLQEGTWYMIKVGTITFDEKTSEDKIVVSRCMVCAKSLEDAIARFRKMMDGTMQEWKFVAVQETRYMDYFKA